MDSIELTAAFLWQCKKCKRRFARDQALHMSGVPWSCMFCGSMADLHEPVNKENKPKSDQ